MRLDRQFTVGVVRPLLRAARVARAPSIPILMYHSISDDLDDGRRPYYRTVTSPARFRRQMSALRERGLRTLTLSEAARSLATPGLARADPAVVVTFDDGYRDFSTTAFPIMQEMGMSATVFVSTGYIGRSFFDGRPCLSEGDLESLACQGVEFGSHTVTHPQLRDVPRAQMVDELASSRRRLTTLLGKSVVSFSYPFRFPSEDPAFMKDLGDALSDCGYRQGVTTVIGLATPVDPPYFLRRLPVNDCDDESFFAAKLDGHYDWLQLAQSARKRLRTSFGI